MRAATLGRALFDAVGLFSLAMALAFVGWAWANLPEACPGEELPNHSGVMECHVGPYLGPLPVDTTGGADIVL